MSLSYASRTGGPRMPENKELIPARPTVDPLGGPAIGPIMTPGNAPRNSSYAHAPDVESAHTLHVSDARDSHLCVIRVPGEPADNGRRGRTPSHRRVSEWHRAVRVR